MLRKDSIRMNFAATMRKEAGLEIRGIEPIDEPEPNPPSDRLEGIKAKLLKEASTCLSRPCIRS